MANGDDAVAAGMDKVLGSADRRLGYDEINKTRDYIAQRTSTTMPISKGGTGATNASSARSNLGLLDVAAANSAEANKLPRYNGSGQLAAFDPTLSGHVASKNYVDTAVSGKVSPGADVTFGQIYTPSSFAATSGWTAAYINSDGRISKGASSERFKKFISAVDPMDMGDIFPQLVRYKMRQQIDGGPLDGAWHYGNIAERLAENPATAPFVVYETTEDGKELVLGQNGAPIPESIDYVALLVAQVAQLHARSLQQDAVIEQLTARLDALEGGQ